MGGIRQKENPAAVGNCNQTGGNRNPAAVGNRNPAAVGNRNRVAGEGGRHPSREYGRAATPGRVVSSRWPRSRDFNIAN